MQYQTPVRVLLMSARAVVHRKVALFRVLVIPVVVWLCCALFIDLDPSFASPLLNLALYILFSYVVDFHVCRYRSFHSQNNPYRRKNRFCIQTEVGGQQRMAVYFGIIRTDVLLPAVRRFFVYSQRRRYDSDRDCSICRQQAFFDISEYCD